MLSSKEKKRLYDMEYRRLNKEKIKAREKAYYEANKERFKKEGVKRRSQEGYYERHNEYCRQPEYVKKKKQYDRVRRAVKTCGKLWESHILCVEIMKLVREKEPCKKKRLYYKLNVQKIIKRNKDKRIENALNEIVIGNYEVLNKAWSKENREFLEGFCVKKDNGGVNG